MKEAFPGGPGAEGSGLAKKGQGRGRESPLPLPLEKSVSAGHLRKLLHLLVVQFWYRWTCLAKMHHMQGLTIRNDREQGSN